MTFANLAASSRRPRQHARYPYRPATADASWGAGRAWEPCGHVLQAVARFTQANKHDVVARRKTTRRCQANQAPLPTGSEAIRFAEHLIGGVPDCTQGLDAVLMTVSAKDLDRVKPEALHVDANTSGQRHLVLRVPLQFFKLRLLTTLAVVVATGVAAGRVRSAKYRRWRSAPVRARVPIGGRPMRGLECFVSDEIIYAGFWRFPRADIRPPGQRVTSATAAFGLMVRGVGSQGGRGDGGRSQT
jgi:hypothetical protein